MKLLDSDSEPQVSPKKRHIEPKENVSQFLDLEAGVSPGRWSSDEELPEEEDGYEPSFINDEEGGSEQGDGQEGRVEGGVEDEM